MDTSDRILRCVQSDYKSITQIAEEIGTVKRDAIVVNVRKLFKLGRLLRKDLDKSIHKRGHKYKAKSTI